MTELGHVDFYPGSTYYQDWGWNQPGCWQVEDVGSCSHSRSHDLFISSITRPCHALQTCSDTEDIPGTCVNITHSAPVMGWWSAAPALVSGQEMSVFTVNTTSAAPFCGSDKYTRSKLRRKKKKKILWNLIYVFPSLYYSNLWNRIVTSSSCARTNVVRLVMWLHISFDLLNKNVVWLLV